MSVLHMGLQTKLGSCNRDGGLGSRPIPENQQIRSSSNKSNGNDISKRQRVFGCCLAVGHNLREAMLSRYEGQGQFQQGPAALLSVHGHQECRLQ